MNEPVSPSFDRREEQDARNARRRRGFIGGLVLGTIGAGLVGFAIGATMPAAEAALGMAHRGFGHGSPPTPEAVKEHAEFFVGFALHRLDATDEQEARIQSIIDGAIDQAFPIVAEHRANRDELRAILAGTTIDRAAIEKLRGEEVALVDSLSKMLAAAIADSAEVLSLDQRTALIERIERFHHRH